jgi:hypothetical protein
MTTPEERFRLVQILTQQFVDDERVQVFVKEFLLEAMFEYDPRWDEDDPEYERWYDESAAEMRRILKDVSAKLAFDPEKVRAAE